jgi:hypothetical protein
MPDPILTPPPMPKPPELPEKPRGSWLSIALAGMLGVVALIVLSFLTLGQMLPVAVIGGLIFAFVGFHYVVWGWWLGKLIQQAGEEEDEEK